MVFRIAVPVCLVALLDADLGEEVQQEEVQQGVVVAEAAPQPRKVVQLRQVAMLPQVVPQPRKVVLLPQTVQLLRKVAQRLAVIQRQIVRCWKEEGRHIAEDCWVRHSVITANRYVRPTSAKSRFMIAFVPQVLQAKTVLPRVKPLLKETVSRLRRIASKEKQSAAETTHGPARMHKQASRSVGRNLRRSLDLTDPQVLVRNHVEKVEPLSVVRLSKNVMYILGWDWGVIFTSVTILPAEDHKDRSRVVIVLGAITPVVDLGDRRRVVIAPAVVEALTRAMPHPEVVEDPTRVMLRGEAGDPGIVPLQARVPLPVRRVQVRAKKAPHVPVPGRSLIALEKVLRIAAKMAAGHAGMMRTMARSLREQVMKPQLVLHFSRVSGMRS
ncbi:MAG: hypothetical protein Greene041662_210 [Candidatus Peregrinibacteria bacterium Greene0416_62]|nr:MAG: hypothetical protein Greene041662_210 [Candidatus Peregrinibacteria bacterium Greene0416_62]TSC99569.1 MAG: hypothetical protein Greene101449_604 [Candidatus Peregrinibacteria bacterium Greene1014_49]